jgi:hypothetical protein
MLTKSPPELAPGGLYRSRVEPVHRIGLGYRSGRDSRRHAQINRYIQSLLCKADISISQQSGHFYFAPTHAVANMQWRTGQPFMPTFAALLTLVSRKPELALFDGCSDILSLDLRSASTV